MNCMARLDLYLICCLWMHINEIWNNKGKESATFGDVMKLCMDRLRRFNDQ